MEIEKAFHELQKVVKEAGEIARTYFYAPQNPNAQKEDGTLVTEVDKKIENVLREFIGKYFPNDTIVGEEEEYVNGNSGYAWYLDPIDGTGNLVRKVPFFGITAARLGPGPEGSFSVIYNPVSTQMFSSLMEQGTYENQNVCKLTAETIGTKYFITVSGNKTHAPWVRSSQSQLWHSLRMNLGSAGHFNSSLLELANVAAGRFDGFLSLGHEPWDSAAGLYLVKAAGGAISIFDESGWARKESEPIKSLYGEAGTDQVICFASHPDIHDEVLEFIGDPKEWSNK